MLSSGLGDGQQQTNIPKLLQDEDVSHHRHYSHDFWSLLVILQLLVSNVYPFVACVLLAHLFCLFQISSVLPSQPRVLILVSPWLLLFFLFFFYRHFRKFSSLIFVLIPELFFMLFLFGYLVFMVVYKWVAYAPSQSKIAPSILIHFIDMFLFTENPDNPPLYQGQVCASFVSFTKGNISGLLYAFS